ncbi:MAG: hypothetical protein U9Q71_02865, partial [Pseudomonadota bacterium]|nr:hypothetical protein [Pseudomonadota bacterium]
MATLITSETFFRPPELTREKIKIPAVLFNRCRLMLQRCEYDHIFVPIRSMQFIAVIDDEEVIFVDSLNYAVRDDEGGRMILLAWGIVQEEVRDSLSAPVSVDLIHYAPTSRDLHRRVMVELPKALDLLEERAREHG